MIEIAALDMARNSISEQLADVDDRIVGRKLIHDYAQYCELIGFRRGLVSAANIIENALKTVREA